MQSENSSAQKAYPTEIEPEAGSHNEIRNEIRILYEAE